MPKNRKKAQNTTHGPAGSKHGWWKSMGRRLTRLPQWTWWTIAGVAAFSYVWAFYVFFVEPFGFRWRAVFGDPSYPKVTVSMASTSVITKGKSTGPNSATPWWTVPL